jgi:hypothetical protein
MKKIYLIFTITLFFACDNREFKSYYPAYPPMNIKLSLLSTDVYGNNYLLLFSSGNIYNSRFGGFLIFVNTSETDLLQMKTTAEVLNILGIAATPAESSSIYNPGIDMQVAILFTNNPIPPSTSYTLTKTLPYTTTDPIESKNFIAGKWFTMRAYLWDSTNNIILEVSDPGNTVIIP